MPGQILPNRILGHNWQISIGQVPSCYAINGVKSLNGKRVLTTNMDKEPIRPQSTGPMEWTLHPSWQLCNIAVNVSANKNNKLLLIYYYKQFYEAAAFIPITSPCSCTSMPRSLKIWLTSVMSAYKHKTGQYRTVIYHTLRCLHAVGGFQDRPIKWCQSNFAQMTPVAMVTKIYQMLTENLL